MVNRDPACPGRSVDHGVEQRPVCDRVRAVGHGLSLPVRAGHRAAIEMIAADHDWCPDRASRHEVVEGEAGAVALAVPEPADPRRETLEGDPLPGTADPA